MQLLSLVLGCTLLCYAAGSVQDFQSDKAALDKLLKNAGAKLVVLDFYASWCGPCKTIAPKFKEFSEKYTNVVFVKVNAELDEEINTEYGVSALPTFIFIKNSRKVDLLQGAVVADLEKLIKKHA